MVHSHDDNDETIPCKAQKVEQEDHHKQKDIHALKMGESQKDEFCHSWAIC